jgi:hypothetical protein
MLRVLRGGQGRGTILARVRAGPVTGVHREAVRRAALDGGRGPVLFRHRLLLRGGSPGRGADGTRRHRGGHLVPGQRRGYHRAWGWHRCRRGDFGWPPLAVRGRGRGRDPGWPPVTTRGGPGFVRTAVIPAVGLATAGLGRPVLAGGRIAQAGALVLLYQVQPDDHSQHNDRHNGWQADHERSHRTIQQA